MMDTKNATIKFDKMEIKNAERLGQSANNDESLVFKPSVKSELKKELQYAEVIDIEDPSKESI